mmetsp:Transcript_146459/g.467871  ORF Transcript_146459/g.467871 Transcript_146459/m.467871 type:complete len:285 (-) Transcript_146459:70-924(-)
MAPRTRPVAGALAVGAAASACWLAGSAVSGFVSTALHSPRGTSSALTRAAVPASVAGPATGKFNLRYFDIRGVAETARILFALAGEEYEDSRYPLSFGTPGDFSTIKREEFEADRAAGKMEVAMGKVPVLGAGDFSLPQSKAIERYLANKFGMMGSTPEEAAWVDAVGEHVRDINTAYGSKGLFGMKDAEKKKEIQAKWFGEELPVMLKKLDVALPGSDGFAVGSKISYADVLIFRLFKDTYTEAETGPAGVGEGCPKLQAIAKTVGSNANMQKWMEERPKTMF